jgi:uncharacterized protein YukE
MAGKYGADVEQLRQLAHSMSTASDRLERDRLTVGHQIKISAWVGPFAATFKAQWESEHSLHVASVARVLEENATQLRKNADEQEAASAADGGAWSGKLLPSPFGPGDLFRPAIGPDDPDYLRKLYTSIRLAIEAIREGKGPLGVKPWDLLTSLGHVRHIPGLEGFSNFMDSFTLIDKITTGTFDGYDAADQVAILLKSTHNPIASLIGANINVWSEVHREGARADFSPENLQRTGDYAAANPGIVIEEVGKATIQIGSKIIGWLL